MRFFGRYVQRLDTSRRVVVPRVLRDLIGEAELVKGLILTRGFDNCICLFPTSTWEKAVSELTPSVFVGAKARMLQRVILGEAAWVSADAHGRIRLPDHLCEVAGLVGEEVVFLGVGARIELWAPDRWAAMQAAAAEHYEELGEEPCPPPSA